MARILVIDDNPSIREGAAAVAARAGHRVETAESGDMGWEAFRRKTFDVVLTDLKMDGIDGLEVLRRVKAERPETAVLMMTAYGSIENAVEAMKLGALDYVQKPFSPSDLRVRLDKALEWVELSAAREKLQGTRALLGAKPRGGSREDGTFCGMIGESACMRTLFERIEKVAGSDTPVHVSGESGTGKELVAGAIHRLSDRAEGPLITVNCGAIPETLFESELFGHEKGAFTGAVKRKLGRFELADGGTLFLDEVGEIPLSLQGKLLRVLQEQTFERIGETHTRSVDVRVIAATNRDLKTEVEAGRFREDLYFRLNVFPIESVPLRERPEDIPPLAQLFLRNACRRFHRAPLELSHANVEALQRYSWPGNVRELENVIERQVIVTRGRKLSFDLPADREAAGPEPVAVGPEAVGTAQQRPLTEAEKREQERENMISALRQCRGKVFGQGGAAELLEVKPTTLASRLKRHGIDPRHYRGVPETGG